MTQSTPVNSPLVVELALLEKEAIETIYARREREGRCRKCGHVKHGVESYGCTAPNCYCGELDR